MTAMNPPDPLQRRAEDLCALLERYGAELFAAPRLAGLDPYADDFGARWLSEFSAALGPLWPACLSLFGRQLPEQAVLQQCWSVAMAQPLWLGMLYRAACAAGSSRAVSPMLLAEASRLKAITAARWRTDAMAVALMAVDATAVVVPDLGPQTALKGSLRLRYRLASLAATGAALQGLIDAAGHQSGVTDYQRRVELARAVHGAQSAGRRWRLLREVEYLLLTPKSRQLVIGTPALWPLLLGTALQRLAALPDHLAGRIEERDRLSRWLASMMLAVRERRLDQAGVDIARLHDSALLRQLVLALRREQGGLRRLDADFGLATLHGRDGRAWAPMEPVALARLSSLCGRAMPVWWAMSAGKVAQQLAIGVLGSSDLPLHDLVLLRRGWCEADEWLLISAGKGGLLLADAVGWRSAPLADLVRVANEPGKFGNFGRQKLADRLLALPDARPWLLCMAGPQARALRDLADRAISSCAQTFARSWGRFVSSAIGTPEWHGVIDAVQDQPGAHPLVFMYGLALLADGRTPVAPQGFGQAMLASLCWAVGDGAVPLPSSAGLHGPLHEQADQAAQAAALSLNTQRLLRHLLPAVLRWLVLDPQATDGLVDEGPEPLLLALAAHPESPLPLLDRLRFSSRPVLQRAAWRQRLQRVTSLDDLRDLTLHLPPQVGLLPWRTRWLSLATGDPLQRAVTLLTCARRNGWWLRGLHKHLGEPLWLDGLQGAIRLLKASAPREAAMLELVRAVGAELAPPLMAVFAAARRSASPGHKLDTSYTRSLRPKKSGGQRVILAPGRALKRVQRAVLDHLLLPLGSHACAFGFVPGRSICDNAAPHVGQPVVVNADVSNCFPSVKWPLVLGALRRDLGDRLGPVAVSMLVDICTAEGGLPVGAPTSPTLLNRVLWRSDEMLAQAAEQRGLRYTRYADDLSFSGGDSAVQMLGVARRTLAQIGLALDPKKTNIFRRGRRQMVTGLVVNQQVSVPRHIRRRLRAAVHRVEQGGVSQWDGAEQSAAALRGRVAFVKMVHAQEGRSLLRRLRHAGAEAGLKDGQSIEQNPLTEDGDETKA